MGKKIIYLIEKTVGSYEDRYVSIEGATRNKERAEKYIDHMNQVYSGLSEIEDVWDRYWDPKLVEVWESLEKEEGDYTELIDTVDMFLEFLKIHFPEDVEKFGEERLKVAFDSYERGELSEIPFYSLAETYFLDGEDTRDDKK